MSSISRLSFRSTILGIRMVASIMCDVIGGRVEMVVPDLGFWSEGGGSCVEADSGSGIQGE